VSYCEFLYDDTYGKIPPAPGIVLYQLPTGIVKEYANPHRCNEAWLERDYLQTLAEDIGRRGIHTPLELHVDLAGMARLKEGHHRVLVAEMQGLPRVPCTVKQLQIVMDRGERAQLIPRPMVGLLHEWLDLLTRKGV
jgi:hypothetical protein